MSVAGGPEPNDRFAPIGPCPAREVVMRTTEAPPRPWLLVATAAAVLAYAWIAAGLRPFTSPEELLVALPVIPVVILTARRGQPAAGAVHPSAARDGTIVWVGLVVALVGWELAALFSSPRSEHPTMSSITDRIMSVHVGRAGVFVLWLVLGGALALRPRGRRAR
jgi:hypothetical protein